jgi:hypothetical protein
MGNLSVRLDPEKAVWVVEQDEDGDWRVKIYEGYLDTGVDSQSRLTSVLKANRNPLGTFKGETRFAVRIWIANDDLAARVGSDYNTRGDKVNDTAAKFAYQDNAEKRIARKLLEGSAHLGVDNVEVLKNTVSASSPKLFAFNTLTQAMETYWRGDEEQLQAEFLVKFWDALVEVRKEFGRLGKSARQELRGASMAGTALSIHGVIAVASEVYIQDLDPKKVLAPLGEPVYYGGKGVDYFSYENPIWMKIGALVSSVGKDGQERQTLRMSFQTRSAVANELKSRTGIAASGVEA